MFPKNRLESFSDGVIAIIITIMVLELKAPEDASLAALKPLIPVFLSYLLSYVYIAIFWSNHHHLLHAAPTINAKIMGANLLLLFWIALIPFATAWIGENHGAEVPAAFYGIILFFSGLSYLLLQSTIIEKQGKNSKLAQMIGEDWKGKLSLVSYAAAIPLAFVNPSISDAIYILIALLWIIPDPRIERGKDS